MAAAAKPAEVVELEAEPAAPTGPRCATCPFYGAFTGNTRKTLDVGGSTRGDCRLEPTIVKKEPAETCAHHPERVKERERASAEVMGEAIGKAIAAAINQGKRT